MDISLNTLDLLVGNDKLHLLQKPTTLESNRDFKNDILFYRKRIFQITKECLKFKPVNQDVLNAFNAFAKEVISFFKFEDKKDIFQNDYKDLDAVEQTHRQKRQQQNTKYQNTTHRLSPIEEERQQSQSQSQSQSESNNPDDLLMNLPEVKAKTIDECLNIKTIKTQSKEIQILPQQKKINLREKHLRTKGVKKKKNK